MKFSAICTCILSVTLSSMGVSVALAGTADMKTADGNHMQFEYEGDNLRINTAQEGSYMIINNDGMYVVNNSGGQLMVIDAGKMMGMFGDMAATAPSVASSKVVSLQATGRQEEYAGIKGEVYNLEYVEESSGQVQTTELVLSEDTRARNLTKAITRMAAAMVKAAGQNAEGVNELQQRMASLNKGVLRYGNDMWVTAISDKTVASERFVLPAEPTDFSGMAGIADAIKQAGSSQSGADSENKGLVSGILSTFSKQADEQTERQRGRLEE